MTTFKETTCPLFNQVWNHPQHVPFHILFIYHPDSWICLMIFNTFSHKAVISRILTIVCSIENKSGVTRTDGSHCGMNNHQSSHQHYYLYRSLLLILLHLTCISIEQVCWASHLSGAGEVRQVTFPGLDEKFLGIDFMTSERTVSAHNCWAISTGTLWKFLNTKY